MKGLCYTARSEDRAGGERCGGILHRQRNKRGRQYFEAAEGQMMEKV